MATNQYFKSNFRSPAADQSLVESLIIESIKIYGIDVKYIPRDFVNLDQLFGEDQSSAFTQSYEIEVYVKNIDSFGGDGKFLSKFGLEIRDEFTFSVSRKRFTDEVTSNNTALIRPREGDLLFLPTPIDKRNRLFEITYVNSEEVFYQIGKLYTFEIRCKLFELGGESFNTGVAEIDSYDSFAINKSIIMEQGTGDFIPGQIVTIQNSTDSATVVFWSEQSRVLVLSNIKGEFDSGIVTSTTASWEIGSTDNDVVAKPAVNNDNDFLNTKSIDIVDFSEKNPFSE